MCQTLQNLELLSVKIPFFMEMYFPMSGLWKLENLSLMYDIFAKNYAVLRKIFYIFISFVPENSEILAI